MGTVTMMKNAGHLFLAAVVLFSLTSCNAKDLPSENVEDEWQEMDAIPDQSLAQEGTHDENNEEWFKKRGRGKSAPTMPKLSSATKSWKDAFNKALEKQKPKNLKCVAIDPYGRATDNWCNMNCNHAGSQFCPKDYCKCEESPTAPPEPTRFDPANPEEMCARFKFGRGRLSGHFGACCTKSCGKCGGPKCGSRDGGKKNCCVQIIRASGKNCKNSPPPCMW